MKAALVCAFLFLPLAAEAKVVTEAVPYRDGDVRLEGLVAYDDAATGKRPGVIVVHEWWGRDDFAVEQARRLAELGYVALAADMYGQGVVTSDPAEAGKLAGPFRQDPALFRARGKAALEALSRHERVDGTKIAAIGFCFGGTAVLQMAAGGLDLAAVVSFHGSLPAWTTEEARRIKARVLVLHGAADTHVPDEAVKAFEDALRATAVDWQLVVFSGAKHSFMNPAADRRASAGVGYDATAARRAWQYMRWLLEETLGAARK